MSRDFWSSTVLTVKGPSRGGHAEQAYASFLCSPSMCKNVLKQGLLLKKARRTERWLDRFVVLRAAFITIAHSQATQGSMSKVYQILRVVDGQARTDLVVYPSNHDECENIQLRCASAAERQEWKELMMHGVAKYHEALSQIPGRAIKPLLPHESAGHAAASPPRPHAAPSTPVRSMHGNGNGKLQAGGTSALRHAGSDEDNDATTVSAFSPPSSESQSPRLRVLPSPPSEPLTPERLPRAMATDSRSSSKGDLLDYEQQQHVLAASHLTGPVDASAPAVHVLARGPVALAACTEPARASIVDMWARGRAASREIGVVGAFWHSSGHGCVAVPAGCGHASAMNAVLAFATTFGEVDAVRVLPGCDDDEGSSSSIDSPLQELQREAEDEQSTTLELQQHQHVAEEVLTWLWDVSASRAASRRPSVEVEGNVSGRDEPSVTLVLLTNLSGFSRLFKRVMSRGVRVIIVSDHEVHPNLATPISESEAQQPGSQIRSNCTPLIQHVHARHVWSHSSKALESGGGVRQAPVEPHARCDDAGGAPSERKNAIDEGKPQLMEQHAVGLMRHIPRTYPLHSLSTSTSTDSLLPELKPPELKPSSEAPASACTAPGAAPGAHQDQKLGSGVSCGQRGPVDEGSFRRRPLATSPCRPGACADTTSGGATGNGHAAERGERAGSRLAADTGDRLKTARTMRTPPSLTLLLLLANVVVLLLLLRSLL